MWTIRALAKRHGLSRTTLLYYDRLGLLRPSGRAPNGYRVYGAEDDARLAQLRRYRAAGLPLARIRPLLGRGGGNVAEALEQRLTELNGEVAELRKQQQVVLELLAVRTGRRSSRAMTKEGWIRLLASAGLDEGGRAAWHRAFERQSPEAHQDFLESLGLGEEEIRAIRARSRRSGSLRKSGDAQPRALRREEVRGRDCA